MISFKDMVDSSEKKDNGMPEMKTLGPKVKEEVQGLIEKAKALLEKSGVSDPAEWIQNYCDDMGMDKEMEEDDMPGERRGVGGQGQAREAHHGDSFEKV